MQLTTEFILMLRICNDAAGLSPASVNKLSFMRVAMH